MSRNPTMAEVIRTALDRRWTDLRVALPGRVESYDSAKQLVQVQPLIKEPVEGEDGTVTQERLPVVTNVPVIFPSGGGMRLTFPIQAGDTGLLVFSDRSLDLWLDQGGEVAPEDARRHHVADAVFFPGLHPNNDPWSGADTSVITIGSDSGTAQFVALANLVLDRLNELKSAINGWTPIPSDGGAALKTALTTLFTTWPASVASATVKVKG